MLFENISILDKDFQLQTNQYVVVEGAHITHIGDALPEGTDAASFGRRIDGAGRLLVPALYNAHAHAPMTLLRGYAENLPLDRWLNEKCWPFEAKMTPEDNYWATLLACAEMSRYGVVSYSDMYYSLPQRAQATIEAGMKANLCEGLLAFEPKPYADYPICAQNEGFVRDWNGAADGRIVVDYNIHAEYTSNPQVCSDIIAILKENGLRLHMHLSETKSEVEECRGRHDGMSPVEYFDSLGAFDVPTTAAHCVWLSDNDMDILQAHNVFIANNPVSNMKLGSGFARIPEMLERGMNVCLGSDGMASNNNHNLFGDMYVMGLIYKGSTLNPAVVDPTQILRAATEVGALSQGRTDCGRIEVGYRADLCMLDITGPQWTPMTSAPYNVVFAGDGSDCVLTVCDGQVVYEAGEWPGIDIERVKSEVAQRAARIISEL
jgi:5-methylthioadenosine/S-adenosylhomocysteine deaminase